MDQDAMLRKEEESLLVRFRISKLFSVLRFLAAVVLSVLLYWLQCTSTEVMAVIVVSHTHPTCTLLFSRSPPTTLPHST